jgi:abortive infection bacteriophage resistance protein
MPLVDYAKPALTFDDQIALLQRRGMTFDDLEAARRTLSHVSYYRLSAYWHPFKQSDDSFRPGTRFEEALRLYEFDRRLRLCILDGIERVEVVARTAVTYALSHALGPFAHTRSEEPDRSRRVVGRREPAAGRDGSGDARADERA